MAQVKPSLDVFKEIKLFKCFSDQELQEIMRICEPKSALSFSNIVIEGEMSWGLYLIADGTVGVFKANQLGGPAYDVGQLTAGNFFGEMSLIEENPRSATVQALTDCHLFFVSKEAFNQFLNKSQERKDRFLESCIRLLVNRLRELNDIYVVTQYQLWKKALSEGDDVKHHNKKKEVA